MARRSGYPARGRSSYKRQVAWGFGPNHDQGDFTGVGKTLWTSGIAFSASVEGTIVRI